MLTFEEKLLEFYNMKSDERFKSYGCACFSSGTKAGSWFLENKNIIFALNNEISNKIKEDYYNYINNSKLLKEAKKERIIKKRIEFERLCTLFYNIKGFEKYNEDSNIMITKAMSSFEWFNLNKKEILNSNLEICKLLKIEYEKYEKYKKEKAILDNRKKMYEFYLDKKLEKFEKSNLKFKDGTPKYKWFYDNIDTIYNASDVISEAIRRQHDIYLKISELKEEFIKCPNLMKYDENSNIRFKSGALMYFFFEQNFSGILNLNNKLDLLIMEDYKKYIMIKDLYYDEEDLVIKRN